MRRWNPLFLLAPLFVVALLAPALASPNRAMAAAPSRADFKGKAAVYYRTSSAYYVVNFACSGGSPGVAGTLSGNWTFETTSAVSYSGPVVSGTCTLSSGGPPWSLSTSTITLSCGTANCGSATLDTLTLLTISQTKTYVDNEYCPPPPDPTKPQCIVINASVTDKTSGQTFSFMSRTTPMADYGTLTMQLPKL